MGIGSMFVVLVIAIVILPMIVQYIDSVEPHFSISGFKDIDVPAIPPSNDKWRPDNNTSYICRSPNDNGAPCPEGQFCDGPTQQCISNYVSGFDGVTGYFS